MQRANSVLLRSVFSAATVCAVLRAAIFSGADRGGSIPIGKVWETGRIHVRSILAIKTPACSATRKKPYKNERPPSDYFKTNILVDCMGFNPIGLRAAVEMCGVDRVVFGSDYGPIPYGIKEHVQIVEDVLSSPAERQQVFWRTSNRVFRLGLVDTDLVTPRFSPISAVA